MIIPFPFVGGSYTGRSKNINSQRCVNLFPVVDQEGGKSVVALQGTAGLKELHDYGANWEIRALHILNNKLYSIAGNNIFAEDATGYTLQDLGIDPPLEGQGGRIVAWEPNGTLDTSVGHVWTADNGAQLLVVDGKHGYIYEHATNTFQHVQDTDFPKNPTSCTFKDGYFIVTAKDSSSFYISASYDGHDWDPLDYATAEGKPDKLLACFEYAGDVWLFGQQSIEIWYNSGDPDFPFQRLPKGIIEIGIGAIDSIAKNENFIFWLDNKRNVQMSQTYAPQIISTPQIAYQFAQYSVVDDAVGFTYDLEGYKFYQLNFPTEKRSWIYCQTTGFWHEQNSAPGYERHRANCAIYYDGKTVIGDYTNGKLYHLDPDTYTDDGETIIRKRTSTCFDPKNRKRIFFNSFEIEIESGVGLVTGQGSDPQVMLQWSDDNGHTWSNEHWSGMGQIGEYNYRAKWRRLGKSRDRIFQVTISDPIKTTILGSYLDSYFAND